MNPPKKKRKNRDKAQIKGVGKLFKFKLATILTKEIICFGNW